MKIKYLRCLLLFCSILSYISSFAQKDTTIGLDANLSISMPANYTTRDTMGLRLVYANSDTELLLIVATPMKGDKFISVSNVSELDTCYAGMINGALKQSNGVLLERKLFAKDGLRMTTFVIRAAVNGEYQTLANVGIVLNNVVYLIQARKRGTDNELVTNTLNRISIHGNAGLENQLNNNETKFQQGYGLGYYIIGPLLLLSLIIFIILMARKKSKK